MSKYEHKTTQNGHQDSIVLHRSSQKAKWHLQSWLGKWKLTEKLSWQKLLNIISIVLILQIVWYDFNHKFKKKVSQKLFIIIVKIASVLHLVICLVLVGPSSPSKLKLYGAISWAEDKNFCAPTCSGSKIFAQPIVRHQSDIPTYITFPI